ncbi:unnamed protein product [Acanthosepion pharaonis]|uniref:Uncharacterized protein n=1 Tax=Acanthosepion pharaonis TaxID=158019 RepID=A0A812BFP3_ACAPH|nr:unnamed protein product [Sepia pharaonis]
MVNLESELESPYLLDLSNIFFICCALLLYRNNRSPPILFHDGRLRGCCFFFFPPLSSILNFSLLFYSFLSIFPSFYYLTYFFPHFPLSSPFLCLLFSVDNSPCFYTLHSLDISFITFLSFFILFILFPFFQIFPSNSLLFLFTFLPSFFLSIFFSYSLHFHHALNTSSLSSSSFLFSFITYSSSPSFIFSFHLLFMFIAFSLCFKHLCFVFFFLSFFLL